MEDCFLFRWVQRDSYLPVGSQNLKAVTKVGMTLYISCLQKTIERTSEEPKICIIKIVINPLSARIFDEICYFWT